MGSKVPFSFMLGPELICHAVPIGVSEISGKIYKLAFGHENKLYILSRI
jgi:hypothetical protein